MRLTKLSATIACLCAALVVGALPAAAASYKLPLKIEGTASADSGILKIYVDNGDIRRVGFKDGVHMYEATMEGDACSTEIRVTFVDGVGEGRGKLTIPYNVCTEDGVGITSNWVRG